MPRSRRGVIAGLYIGEQRAPMFFRAFRHNPRCDATASNRGVSEMLPCIVLTCPPAATRTRNQLLKRQLLYQLSYGRNRGVTWSLAYTFSECTVHMNIWTVCADSTQFLRVGQVGIEPTSLAGHDLKSCAYTNSATGPYVAKQREATAGLEPAHKSFADSRVTPSPRGRVRTNDERLPMTTHKTKETIAQTRTPSPRGHVSNAQRANYTITFSLIHRYAGDFSRLSL